MFGSKTNAIIAKSYSVSWHIRIHLSYEMCFSAVWWFCPKWGNIFLLGPDESLK